jgi:hypothetical protein
MNARIQWIDDAPTVGLGTRPRVWWLGDDPKIATLGATAAKPAVYPDCNLAAPSEAGKGIIRRLQARLQTEVPNSGVVQTGFVDAETCAAWRDGPTSKFLTKIGFPYPGNFNVTNILDKLDGASVDPKTGKIVHHWVCQGAKVSSDCTKSKSRGPGADPCPEGKKRNEATGLCEDVAIECPPGQQLDPATGTCVDSPPFECPEGMVRNAFGICEPTTCPPGFEKNLATGECEAITCPPGQVFNPATSKCEAPPQRKTSRRKSDTGGLLLLAAAAVAAISIAVAA